MNNYIYSTFSKIDLFFFKMFAQLFFNQVYDNHNGPLIPLDRIKMFRHSCPDGFVLILENGPLAPMGIIDADYTGEITFQGHLSPLRHGFYLPIKMNKFTATSGSAGYDVFIDLIDSKRFKIRNTSIKSISDDKTGYLIVQRSSTMKRYNIIAHPEFFLSLDGDLELSLSCGGWKEEPSLPSFQIIEIKYKRLIDIGFMDFICEPGVITKINGFKVGQVVFLKNLIFKEFGIILCNHIIGVDGLLKIYNINNHLILFNYNMINIIETSTSESRVISNENETFALLHNPRDNSERGSGGFGSTDKVFHRIS